MQFASFDLADPVFECSRRRFSFQLVTLENLYGRDPAKTHLASATGNRFQGNLPDRDLTRAHTRLAR